MTVSKVLLSAVIAVTLVPAAAQAANSASPARALSVAPAAQSLSLSSSVRVGAHTGKKSHAFIGLAPIFLVIGGLAVVAGITVAAGAFSNNSPASGG